MEVKKAYSPGKEVVLDDAGPELKTSTPELLGRFPIKATRMAAAPSPYLYVVLEAEHFPILKSALAGVFEGPGFNEKKLCALRLNVVKNEVQIVRMPN